MDEKKIQKSKKKIQKSWGITQADIFRNTKSESEIKKIEDDVKKTGDWETYYERMYEKTKNKKYKEKLSDLIAERIKLEKEAKENKDGGFEKAFQDALIKRIKEDLEKEED